MSDEIKMFIAGEEVVSQNEFTINEEMLSASSTILNNCYPKSWELTKDYISNFYFPKDYSRFVIGQGEYLHGLDEYATLFTSGVNMFNINSVVMGDYAGQNPNIRATTRQELYLEKGTYTIKTNMNLSTYGIALAILPNVPPSSSYNALQDFGYITNQTTTFNVTSEGYAVFTFRKNGNLSFNLDEIRQFDYIFVSGSTAPNYVPYGQDISYETNVEKEWNTLNVYGSTYQEKNIVITNWEQGSGVDNNTQYRIRSKEIFRVRKGKVYKLTWSGTNASSYQMIINSSLDRTSYPFTTPIEVCGNSVSWSATSPIQFTATNDGYMGVIVSYKNGAPISPSNVSNLMITLENFMPTPDYPSDLVSVGYENLFDLANWVTKGNNSTYYSYENGKLKIKRLDDRGLSRFVESEKVILPNGTYTISGYNANGLRVYNNGTDYPLVNQPTFEVTLGYVYLKFVSSTVVECQPIITKGTKAYNYIPYGKYGIEIEVKNSNLIGLDTKQYRVNMLQGEKITAKNTTSTALILNLYTNYGDTTRNDYWSVGSNSTRTITLAHNIGAMAWSSNVASDGVAWVNKGTSILEYQPYASNSQLYILDEPLRAIGQYQDRLYVDNGVLFVERKIGYQKITSSIVNSNYQNVLTNSKEARVNLTNILNITNQYNYVNLLSNCFKAINTTWGNDTIGIMSWAGNPISQIAFRIPVNDDKTFFDNNEVYLQYLLNEPTTTPIGYVDLPSSYEGINYVELETGLETGMDLKYYWKNYNVLFAGVVKNSGDISLNPRHPHYCSLQILDYKTFLSESNTLDFVIANKTISEAISMVVNAVAGYGFVVGEINISGANDIIGAYSTLNKSAYDVLQYLAEISGSRWRARVVDSLTMAIDFYDPDTLPQAEDIEYTQEYFEDNNIVDLTFNYGTRDYRNKQILLSDEVYANINYDETLISNGYSNTFTLQNNIGDIVNVVVDGAEKTIGTNNDKQMGVEADFYFTPGKNVVESNSVYSAGTMIHLTYQPLVKGRQIVYNNSEVDRISRQTQTEGVIARYETRNDVLSSDELEKIAKTYIEYKGKAEVILTLKTQNKDLYNIGEVVYFNAPISDLAQNYMVKSKKTEYVVINKIVNLFYIYELTSSFNSEKAINYFDNQRSKATGNIEEGESITRNVDIETEVGIIWSEGSVSSATVTVTGDNVLNCALNSPFVE